MKVERLYAEDFVPPNEHAPKTTLQRALHIMECSACRRVFLHKAALFAIAVILLIRFVFSPSGWTDAETWWQFASYASALLAWVLYCQMDMWEDRAIAANRIGYSKIRDEIQRLFGNSKIVSQGPDHIAVGFNAKKESVTFVKNETDLKKVLDDLFKAEDERKKKDLPPS